MLGKEVKKENKIKKSNNRVLEFFTADNQDIEKISQKIKPSKTAIKNDQKTIKGKKIDNKTILHQFKAHLDDFPVVLKSNKQIDRFLNNPTFGRDLQDTEYQIPRPNSSLIPSNRQSLTKKDKKQSYQRRKKSNSISMINDIGRENSLQKQYKQCIPQGRYSNISNNNIKKLSKVNKKTLRSQVQLEDDKQNRYSQSRNSFVGGGRDSFGQRKSKIHNRSCNDWDVRSKNYHNGSINNRYYLNNNSKSKTPISKKKPSQSGVVSTLMKNLQNCRQKNNFSCIQMTQNKNIINKTGSLQKKVKKKKTQIGNNQKKRDSSHLSIGGFNQKGYFIKDENNKRINKKNYNHQKKLSLCDLERPQKAFKKKEKKQNLFDNNTNRPRKSFNNEDHAKYLENLKKKKLLIQKQGTNSQQQESYQYISSKTPTMIDIKKKKSRPIPQNLPKTLINKILSNSNSLIKSSLETSKKSTSNPIAYPNNNYQRTLQFAQNIIQQQQKTMIVIPQIKNYVQEELFLRDQNYSESQSQLEFNLQQLRQYQRIMKIKKHRKQKYRKKLYIQIQQEYPQLNQQQIIFLASVIFIQREWRQKKQKKFLSNLYKNSNKKIIQQRIISNIETKKNSQRSDNIIYKQQKQTDYEQDNIKTVRGLKLSINEKNFQKEVQSQEKKVPISNTCLVNQIEITERFQIKNEQNQIQKIDEQNSSQSNLFTEQIFPPYELVSMQKRYVIADFQRNKDKIQQTYKENSMILKSKKQNLQKNFQNSVSQLKKSSKDIQKTYLKYIDCINNIKLGGDQRIQKNKIIDINNKRKLRKVSSENGLMAKVYLKFFKIESFNDSSDSLKKLKRKLLIRKQYIHSNQQQQIIKFEEPLERQLKKTPLSMINLEKKQLQQFYYSNKQQDSKVKDLHFYSNQTQIIQKKSIPSPSNSPQNLNQQANNLNKSNQILISDTSKSQNQHQKQPQKNIQQLKSQQTQQIPQKRRLPGLTSVNYTHSHYLNSFCQYLKGKIPSYQDNYSQQLIENFNTIIGFSPLTYLKLLRDPDFDEPDAYVPLVSNRIYIEYQSIYFASLGLREQDTKFQNFLRAIISIHNKALFQAFVIQLQKMKPYGQQGMPYPWDNEIRYEKKSVKGQKIVSNYFEEAKLKVEQFLNKRCGIIIEKYRGRNEGMIERLHEQNEDRMLGLMEDEIKQGYRYEIREQVFEIKLNISNMVYENLLMEIVSQMMGF